ncbi:MAG: carboxypeptidase-like regulatory domain-containing protein [Armatimonadota bacterium]|nr:carboxypeptidase-like regulatory domain-containing protein [Armatimonadota bacterium]
MGNHYGRALFQVAAAAALVVWVAGCGGGAATPTVPPGTATGSSAGISASASISGVTLSVTARTDRSDIAEVWVVTTNSQGVKTMLSLSGAGRDWSASSPVIAEANSLVNLEVYARDSLGNTYGPVRLQVRMGEFGAQATVTGVVVSDANLPVQGATVTLANQITSTGSDGRWVITGLVPGTYQGTVSKSGYEERTFTVTAVENTTVQAPQVTLPATQDLPPPAPNFD